MKMKQLKNMKRVLIAILLVAMLIPVLAVTAYASDKYPYTFSYNGNGGVLYRNGTKTDTSYAAAASILKSNMNGGSVKFRLERPDGNDLSYWTGSYYGNGNCPLYYYSNVALTNPMAVRLAGRATASVHYISGNFQPKLNTDIPVPADGDIGRERSMQFECVNNTLCRQMHF